MKSARDPAMDTITATCMVSLGIVQHTAESLQTSRIMCFNWVGVDAVEQHLSLHLVRCVSSLMQMSLARKLS